MVKFYSRPGRALAVCLVGAAALATVSCSEESGGTGGQQNGQETVTFLNWEETEGAPLGDAILEFEEQNPDINVEIQPAVIGDAYDAKMRTALAGSNPPDIFRINDDYVQQFTANGTLLDLAPYVEEDNLDEADYASEVFNFGRQEDGRLTSWQIGYQPPVVFYNKDLFEEAGVPLPPTTWSGEDWTWDDFLSAAQALTDGTTQYGAIVTASTNYEQTFANNNGSPTGIWSADGTGFTLADPEGAEAIQWAADLTCVHNVQPRWAELLQPNANVQLFAQGKAAMLFERSGALPYFRDNVTSFGWDIAPPPANEDQATEASVVVFGVPAKAANPDAAWKLLDFLAGEEGGQIVASGGAFVPVNINAAEALYADPSAVPEHIELLAESAQHLTATSKTENTLGARQIYRPTLDEVYNCNAQASDVLQGVRDQVEQALERG